MFPGRLRAAEACAATTPDLYGIGPFRAPSTPERTVLVPPEDPGQRLVIHGKVTDAGCRNPLSGVRIEVWGANGQGCYHHPNSCGDGAEYPLYGHFQSGADGSYRLETVYPGRYLNGSTYRPRHLHFVIDFPNAPLVTQLYFEGDPYIENDFAAGHSSAADRIIPLARKNDKLEGTFDISPQSSNGILDPAQLKDIRQKSRLQIRDWGETLEFSAPAYLAHRPFALGVVDLMGRTRAFVPKVLGSIRLPKRGWKQGRYIAQSYWPDGRYRKLFTVS